jgi:hypothetical protein
MEAEAPPDLQRTARFRMGSAGTGHAKSLKTNLQRIKNLERITISIHLQS